MRPGMDQRDNGGWAVLALLFALALVGLCAWGVFFA